MNRLTLARRTQVINCLVEGNSIRSTEWLTDTHRDTVMRLMVRPKSSHDPAGRARADRPSYKSRQSLQDILPSKGTALLAHLPM